MSAIAKLKEVRSEAIWGYPFWGTLSLRLDLKKMREREEQAFYNMGLVPTMGTDGKELIYSDDFVNELSKDELLFCLVHEILHCILNHHTRRQGRNAQLWNVAADHVVNLILQDCNVGKVPDMKYVDEDGKEHKPKLYCDSQYKDMAVEEVYQKLWDEADKIQISISNNGNGQDDNKGKKKMPGAVLDAKEGTSQEHEENKWKSYVADAAAVAKGIGNLPAGVSKLVENLLSSKIDWRQELADWVCERIKDEYSWLTRNRRIQDVYLPGRDGYTIGNLVIIIDSSGSCWSDEILGKFLGAVQDLRNTMKCSIDIISCDTRPENHKYYGPDESILDYEIVGGGGTDFAPAFEWIDNNLDNAPNGALYFTDTYGSFPEEEPDYKTLWVTWEKEPYEPPFGRLLVVDDD